MTRKCKTITRPYTVPRATGVVGTRNSPVAAKNNNNKRINMFARNMRTLLLFIKFVLRASRYGFENSLMRVTL